MRRTVLATAAIAIVGAAAAGLTLWHRHRQTATDSAAPAPGKSREIQPSELDGRRALENTMRLIALGPRVSGTDGAEKAALDLAAQLAALKIDPSYDIFSEQTAVGRVTFRNISGTIKGTADPAEMIVLLSHFDTKDGISEDFAGANDSGSSCGLLLELARVLKAHEPLPVNVMVAFLDGEECKKRYDVNDGLHGSCRLAARLKKERKARAVILLDMVGDKDLSVTIPRNSSPQLTGLVFAAAREEGARDKFGLHSGSILDDHVPFIKAGIQAVDIIDFEYGSKPGKNDYWHTVNDTPDKLSAESLQTVGRVVIRTLNKLM